MRRHALATLTALTLLLTGAAAAHADVLASTPGPTTVAVGHGVVAWSTYDPADGHYWLTASIGGVVTRLAVPPRGVPFDVDAGWFQGRAVLTYSRCKHEPVRRVRAPLPDWTGGADCRPRFYDVATGTEQHFIGLHVPKGASVVLPSVANGILAFAMQVPGGVPHIYRTVVARPRRLSEDRLATRSPQAAPNDVEVVGSHIAVSWDGLNAPKCLSDTPKLGPLGFVSEIHLSSIGADRRLAQTCDSSALLTFSGVASLGTTVAFGTLSRTQQPSVLERRGQSGALLGRKPLPVGSVWIDADPDTSAAVIEKPGVDQYDIVLF
jgi:hypothetical protein